MSTCKKGLLICLSLIMVLSGILTGCNSKNKAKSDAEIAIVCSAAGKNDNGYNQSAIEGLENIASSLKVSTKVVETSDSLTVPDALKQLASSGAKLIFNLEYDFDALINGVGGDKALAAQFPDTTFVVFNGNPNLDENKKPIHQNVISVLFDIHESSFLAGYLSVYVNEKVETLFDSGAYGFNTNKETNRQLGFLGGTASEGMFGFSYGYMEGISYAAGELGVKYNYISKYDAGFVDATIGSSFAEACFSQGANIVFGVAGNVGTGITSKAFDMKRLAIEVDANKDSVRPGNILTSVLKNTNVPVEAISKAYKDGTLASLERNLSYNLNSGATGITDLATISSKIQESGKADWDEIIKNLDTVSKAIQAGEIVVTNAQIGQSFQPDRVTHLSYTNEMK